jgi:hypothetical protein
MPNLFVVRGQQSSAELAAALLPSRHTAADRTAAEAALTTANPTVDLQRLRPGMVLVVPASIDRLRRGAADDPAGDAADALLQQVRQDLASLVEAEEGAEGVAAQERAQAWELLDGPEVARFGRDQVLAAAAKQLRAELKAEEAAAGEGTAALREAVAGWQSELKELRELL